MRSYPKFINVLRFTIQRSYLVGIMAKQVKGIARVLLVIVLIIIIGGAVAGLYMVLAYPRSVVSFPVSFTIGADIERKEFSVPIFHETVQVQVIVNNGNLLWTASILQENAVLWSHAAHQGGQTTYQSDWVQLPSGSYNFTFATAGIGSLEAEIKVTSKGGFW